MNADHSITQQQDEFCQQARRLARRQRVQPTRGFSLVEVLIALGVFAVGFIAVASMFPAAIMLQKATVIDLESKVVEQNVAAVIKGRGLTFSGSVAADLTPTNIGTLNLLPFTDGTPNAAINKWSISDRGYPTFMTDIASRRFFWVPMIRRTSSPDPAMPDSPNPDPLTPATKDDFQVLGFIQKRQSGTTYASAATDYPGAVANPNDGLEVPKVVRVAVTVSGATITIAAAETQAAKDHFAAFEPGNHVADNRGTSYVITDVTGGTITVGGIVNQNQVTHLWYGAPADGSLHTSTVAIVTLAGLVKDITP